MGNVKKLGEYLARVLDEDQWKTAEDLLNKIDKKFTQEDKEAVYNKYIALISNMCDDLDTFSEIGPKELVYAVLELVEKKISMDDKLKERQSWRDSVEESGEVVFVVK